MKATRDSELIRTARTVLRLQRQIAKYRRQMKKAQGDLARAPKEPTCSRLRASSGSPEQELVKYFREEADRYREVARENESVAARHEQQRCAACIDWCADKLQAAQAEARAQEPPRVGVRG
jgi:multidrug resistance efflux pump